MNTDRPVNRSTVAKPFADLQGASKLAIDAITGITSIVEDMHRNIKGLAPIVGKEPQGGAGGISGFVYSSVRGVTQLVGKSVSLSIAGIDGALAALRPLVGQAEPSPHRDAMLSALNGVFGDYLEATQNPLAINMELRQTTQTPGSKLLILVHGLCMNDVQWLRDGHDHGAALGQALGYTPIYLRYNTGRSIAANGKDFSDCLQKLLHSWPNKITELTIVGHSMGGLVTRSACFYAEHNKHTWLTHLSKLVFLGSPHHGAPLEKAGSWVDVLLKISPYSAPFAKLATVRSAGIKDLRKGSIVDSSLVDATFIGPIPLPKLPKNVPCYAIAATNSESASIKNLLGDGLVSVASALGKHKNPELALPIPKANTNIHYGLNHFDLLSSKAVFADLQRWLQ